MPEVHVHLRQIPSGHSLISGRLRQSTLLGLGARLRDLTKTCGNNSQVRRGQTFCIGPHYVDRVFRRANKC